MAKTCTFGVCDRPHKARGYCESHYGRYQRTGSPAIPTLVNRFWDLVDRGETDECWHWTGYTTGAGYGGMWVGPAKKAKMFVAHRVAYELTKGRIPDTFVIDHLCRNPPCVNPDHLEPVPQRLNVLRGDAPPAEHVKKRHCPQGHPYFGDNLYLSRFGRQCRKCRKAADLRRRARKAKTHA